MEKTIWSQHTGNLKFTTKFLSQAFVLVIARQCWTEGRSSTAVVEDLGPTATAAKVFFLPKNERKSESKENFLRQKLSESF